MGSPLALGSRLSLLVRGRAGFLSTHFVSFRPVYGHTMWKFLSRAVGQAVVSGQSQWGFYIIICNTSKFWK
jgi:hypothetical protein